MELSVRSVSYQLSSPPRKESRTRKHDATHAKPTEPHIISYGPGYTSGYRHSANWQLRSVKLFIFSSAHLSHTLH